MKRMLVITVFAVVPAIVATGVGAQDKREQVMTLKLYAKATEVSDQVSDPPEPGERFLVGRDLFELGGSPDAPEPIGDSIGRNLVVCTVVTATEATCDGHWTLDERGTISATAYNSLLVSGDGGAVVGGTGEFAGARGEVKNVPVPGKGDRDQVWTIELTGLDRP